MEINWKELPFGYFKTDYNIRCYYRNGKWGDIEVHDSEYISIHMAATALHYAQEAFEGLKAYRGKDGEIRLFRWEENLKRMQSSARGILMQEVPYEIFRESIFKAIKLNEKYIPPYGTGASLYIRPLLIGSGPQVGVKPADEYLFLVFVCPVGPYFKEGFKMVKVGLDRSSDRAAPLGTGHIKVGGNYASSLRGIRKAQLAGCQTVLYLDSKEKKFIDEAGPANFFGIKDNTYVTPDSTSILPSITNKSLMELAEDLGMKVERRHIPLEELPTFEETGACGTAAVITPIGEIIDLDDNKVLYKCKYTEPGPYSTMLYNKLLGIQYGDEPDIHKWITIVE